MSEDVKLAAELTAASGAYPYASFTVGGHQYTAKVGDQLEIDYCGEGRKSQDYLQGPAASAAGVAKTLTISDIHVVCTAAGKVHVGKQALTGATLKLKVIEHTRQPKIIVFKKKRRKKYRKMSGHKQLITLVQLTEITLGATK